MTESEAKKKIVDWCKSNLGYMEGANNYNKFAANPDVQKALALGVEAQNQPWCVIFVVAAFVECFGVDTACKMLKTSPGHVAAYVSGIVSGFQRKTVPDIGDMVAYNGMEHIGICVNTNPVQMIDGNYGDGVKYHAENNIFGFYSPVWGYASNIEEKEQETIVNDDDVDDVTDFKVGDWVYCSATREYSGMKQLSPIVNSKGPWRIDYINDDRAVLGANKAGTNNIQTPVKTNTLTHYVEPTYTSSVTNNGTTTYYGTGIQAVISEKINGPVIVNQKNPTTVHTFGGRKENVND